MWETNHRAYFHICTIKYFGSQPKYDVTNSPATIASTPTSVSTVRTNCTIAKTPKSVVACWPNRFSLKPSSRTLRLYIRGQTACSTPASCRW